ncbi:hypothetical protein Tco_1012336 [Tanacetum coccineum]
MSRDVITVGSTMRIPLLYQGEYSQWRERFMNYLEEQTDGEAMINSIQKLLLKCHLLEPHQMHLLLLRILNFGLLKRKRDIEDIYGNAIEKAISMRGSQSMVNKIGKLQFYMKVGYRKDYRELNYKFLNLSTTRMETIWTLMRQTKYLMDYYNCALVQHFEATNTQVDVNDAWE